MTHLNRKNLLNILEKIKRLKVFFATMLEERFPLQEFYEQKRGVKITFEDAQFVAMSIHEHPAVLEVYCFGSVAKKGWSNNDIDLIVVVEEDVWKEFLYVLENTDFRRPFSKNTCYGLAQTRLGITQNAMFFKREKELDLPRDFSGRIDIFLFPPNWQNRLSELQGALPHKDQDLMRNIVQDAKRIV